ncbi:MAG TPA: WGR domain-containing protein [Syntrophales bacterium]|nr:WGR domain-containing protein [Syntrophales bacterium]
MILLRSVDSDRNRFRQYSLDLQPGLIDGMSLVVTWGRLNARRLRRRVYWFPDAAAARRRARAIYRRRLRHHYRVERIGGWLAQPDVLETT